MHIHAERSLQDINSLQRRKCWAQRGVGDESFILVVFKYV